MSEYYRCWAQVDLDALRENLSWLRHKVGPGVQLMAVVKADAYGHGLKEIAALLMQHGANMFGVANLGEARIIRNIGHNWPILMLGACLPDEVDAVVKDEVMPTISSLDEARWFNDSAKKYNKLVKAHLKVDTGMGRLGVEPKRALDLLYSIKNLENISIYGIYTHFASVEDDAEFSLDQKKQFNNLLNNIKNAGINIPLVHADNSGAIMHEPDTLYSLIRPGLLMYGVIPSGTRPLESVLKKYLRPALSLKCRVSLIKHIPKGKPLSYGRTFHAPKPMQVATLTAGYGDGYSLSASNKAMVLINGKRCPIVGRITMDQMIVDVTNVPIVRPGDVAVLIGRQAEDEIPVHQLAEWMNTIPYEVLTNITYRVPRLYKSGFAA
ncbi:MAG: alanine racemase [Verrucomicrobia bacterium]|nr:alanine racemase [Verrucomicrobiota bacterium]